MRYIKKKIYTKLVLYQQQWPRYLLFLGKQIFVFQAFFHIFPKCIKRVFLFPITFFRKQNLFSLNDVSITLYFSKPSNQILWIQKVRNFLKITGRLKVNSVLKLPHGKRYNIENAPLLFKVIMFVFKEFFCALILK